MIYLDRFFTKGLVPTEFNIHKAMLISIMAAHKYLDDTVYDNLFMSKVGGLSLRKLNELEREFLIILDYELYVPEKIFRSYSEAIEKNIKKV